MIRLLLILICIHISTLTVSVSAEAAGMDSVTERDIRNRYIEQPDSCLELLDKAQLKLLDTDMPEYKIDILRAMCYEIKGDYPGKERSVRRLLDNDSVVNIPDRKLKITVMLAGVLDRQNKYEEGISVCRDAIGLARQTGAKKEEAEMLSTMARISFGMKNNDDADRYFRQAIDLLKDTEDVREMSYLSTIYGEMMTFLIDTHKVKEAIDMGGNREALIDRMSTLPGPPPGYIDQQYGFLYAKMAVLLFNDGRPEEAAAVYNKYSALDFARSYTGRLFSVPYLLDAARYAEALDYNSSCLNEYPGDTISYDYLGLLQNQANAFRGLKDYREADGYMRRCYAVQDSIYRREAESKAQEYARLFDSQEKEMQLISAKAESQKNKILFASALTAVGLLLVILWVIFSNLRRTRRKNRIDAKRIDELIAQKEELRKAFSHNLENESLQADRSGSDEVPDDKDYQEFMRMEAIIVENQMFLNPRLGRDDILKVTGVSKNTLVPIIRKYAGSANLNDYINRLRLEYAVKMIKNNKLFTIDSIAETSGFNSRSTFYRVFQNVFGMTPSQYLETQKNNNEPIK